MPNVTKTPKLTADGKAQLDALLKEVDDAHTLPAMYWGATTVDGPIYYNCAGDKDYFKPEEGKVTEDTWVQLFSMTKLVVVVSILQQVEKGVLSLDDAAQVEKYAPELLKLPILTGFDDAGKPTYTERKNPITLRMLLTHTAGLGYDFLSPELTRWRQATGHPAIWENEAGIKAYELPLLFEPGTKYAYSVAIDWAGIILERATGSTLEAYFKKNIFEPLGIKTISFLVDSEGEKRMQVMSGRDLQTDKLIPSPGARQQSTKIAQLSGGAGLVGTLKDYLRFLQGVLAGGSDKGSPIISKKSFDELFTSSLPKRGENNTCHADLTFIMAILGFSDPALVQSASFEQSVGFPINTADSANGRKAGTGSWLGAAKTYYWIDPATGIAAICGTQIINPGVATSLTYREEFLDVYNKYERKLYDVLQ